MSSISFSFIETKSYTRITKKFIQEILKRRRGSNLGFPAIQENIQTVDSQTIKLRKRSEYQLQHPNHHRPLVSKYPNNYNLSIIRKLQQLAIIAKESYETTKSIRTAQLSLDTCKHANKFSFSIFIFGYSSLKTELVWLNLILCYFRNKTFRNSRVLSSPSVTLEEFSQHREGLCSMTLEGFVYLRHCQYDAHRLSVTTRWSG